MEQAGLVSELDQLAEELTLRRDVNENGTIRYYNTLGQLHRVHGPALIFTAGHKFWYQGGLRHRLDGPAGTYPGGLRYWFINGLQVSKTEFDAHPDVIAYAKSKQQ